MCSARNIPRIRICLMFFFTVCRLNDFFRIRVMPARSAEAIIRRQKARETLRMSRSLMKMDDVPNSVPAMIPSVRAVFLFLLEW